MIKTLQDQTGIAISVKLKSGDHFLNRDIPDDPFGEEGWVSFWIKKDTIRSYPLENVEYYEFTIKDAPHGDPDNLLTEEEEGGGGGGA